jgi:Domain of unknown function (DUF4382)/Carboxypeptidase regulatory-like domain
VLAFARPVSYPRTNVISDAWLDVKRLSAVDKSLFRLLPLLAIALLMGGPSGCGGSSSSSTATVPTGSLEIGFVDSPSGPFQSISLNIISVRLNATSSSLSLSDSDPNWVTVTAPPGTAIGSTAELPINLLDFQNDAKVFNTGSIPAQTYLQVEVIVDPNTPGSVIPSCSSSGVPTQEGCAVYRATFTGSTNLRVAGNVTVQQNALTALIIDINPGTPTAPSTPGGNYTMNPTISLVAPATQLLGVVSGTVSLPSATNAATVTAELTGTNSVVATAPVVSGAYSIQLPAAATGGTTYDLYASGTSLSFAAKSGVTVTRGGPTVTENFALVSNLTFGAIAGTVIDGRTGTGLTSATVNLLLAPSAGFDCSTEPGCVVVSSTSSDSAGNYSFTSVAEEPAGTYWVQASATGVDTVTQLVSFSATSGVCPLGPNPSTTCSFKLGNIQMSGTVQLDPAPAAGTDTTVMVLAEQFGTGNLVGLTQVTVLGGVSTPVGFNLEVPDTIDGLPAKAFNFIASAQDSYLEVGTPFSEHSLGIAADVPAGSAIGNLVVTCGGHGTISGLANSTTPDSNTLVLLSQLVGADEVQLMSSTVGSTVGVNGNPPPYPTQYSFCVPPGTYQVQRFEVAQPTPTAVGPPQMVTVSTPAPASTPFPTPAATPTACPLCVNPSGQCPGNCTATNASPL